MSGGPSGAPGDAHGSGLYRGAARIFQALRRREGSKIPYGAEQPLPGPSSARESRGELRTAVCALRYQDILEDVLIDSGFLASSKLPEDLTPLVLVLLYEFHKCKFTLLPFLGSEEEAGKEVTEVANAIYKVKDALLSLEKLGLSQVKKSSELRGHAFLLDKDCDDVIAFPAGLRDLLCDSDLVSSKSLVVQDRSRCILAHCARTILTPAEDVLFATASSGLTPVHVAILREDDGGKVLACAAAVDDSSMEHLRDLAKEMGVSRVTFIPAKFLDLQPADPRLQRVRVIVLSMVGSASGLLDPTDFLLTEGEDITLMQHLAHGPVPPQMVKTFADLHLELLLHAMKFPYVHSILYSTSSVHEEENEAVLSHALKLQPERNSPELVYRLTLPLVSRISSSEPLPMTEDPVLRVEPSRDGSGFFLGQITRQGITVKGILARAVKKGLLDKAMLCLSDKEEENLKVTKRGLRLPVSPKQGLSGSPKTISQQNSKKKQPKQKLSRKRPDKQEGMQKILGVKDIMNEKPAAHTEKEEGLDVSYSDNKAWLWHPMLDTRNRVREPGSSPRTSRLLNREQYGVGEKEKSRHGDLQRSVIVLENHQKSAEDYIRVLEDKRTRSQVSEMIPLFRQIRKDSGGCNADRLLSTVDNKMNNTDIRRRNPASEGGPVSKTNKFITAHSKKNNLVPKKALNNLCPVGIQALCSSTEGMPGMDFRTHVPSLASSQDLLPSSLTCRSHSARAARGGDWEDIRPLLSKGSQSLNLQRSLGRSQVLSVSQIYLPPPDPNFLGVLKKQRGASLKKSILLQR
ncbi:putative methyltransferase NSUN7 isoform X2 [Pleurodeles waltl]|uniref:putative methyltransferase NSUN7 isoform X2 n=1 Tax=Pleurodeles waltl TaxID=8319 RepID=UPI0037096E88